MKRILPYLLICFALSTLFVQKLKAQSTVTFDPLPSHITVNRDYPLMDLPATQTVNVSDYNNPNDGQNIYDAITAAKSLATDSNPVKVVFEPNAIYYIDLVGFSNHAMRIDNAENIILEGNNCQWIMKNSHKAVMFIHLAKNFIVRNITIDYEVLPFTQGIVTDVDYGNSTFTWEKDEGFPNPSAYPITGATMRWGQLKDADGSLKDGARNLWLNPNMNNVSGNTYTCSTFNSTVIENFDIGDYFVIMARFDSRLAFYIEYSEKVTFDNVTIYANIGGAFESQHNREVNIINCKVKPKEGRVHSVNADGIHVTGDHRGIWVQGCEFGGFPDDFANLKHLKLQSYNLSGTDRITVFNPKLAVGDIISFYNASQGILRSTRTVTQVLNEFSGEVQLDGPHNVVSPGGGVNNDIAYFVSRSNQGFIFRDNIINGNRSWGIITQSTQGQIKNNVFRNISTGGIKLSNIPGWYQVEGLFPSYVEVDSNRFYNCATDKETLDEDGKGVIVAKVAKVTNVIYSSGLREEVSAGFQGIKDVWITNNYIEYSKTGIHLQDIDCLTLENNTLVHTSDSYKQNPLYSGENIPMYIKNVNFCNGNDLQGISVYPSQHRLTQINQTFDGLSATVVPVDAPNTSVTWSSSDETVAIVNQNTGVVTAIGEGFAEITATTIDNHTDSCIITVGIAQTTDPQIHYMFDDPAGTGKPENIGQMSDIDGIIQNTSKFITGFVDADKGVVANANGTNSSILLYDTLDAWPGPSGGAARTYSYWIKPRSILSFNSIVYQGAIGNRMSVGLGQYGELLFRHQGMYHYRTVEKLPLNVWNHVTFVFPEGGRFQDAKFYLNGVLCTLDTGAWDFNPSYNPLISTPNRVDGSVFQISSEFDGYLHDWRYYDYALTQAEIQNIYNPILVSSIDINPTNVSMAIAETYQLEIIITPSNASNRFVRWESNNENVATVNPITGVVTAHSQGSAEITATTIDGSNIQLTSTINVTTLSTNTNNQFNSIKIYPNPVNDILNIEIDSKYNNLVANIIDLSGRTIISQQLKTSKNTLNLNSLSEGIYMLNLKDGHKFISIKKIVRNNK